MVINIPSNKDIIFKQYLNLINPILGTNKLTSTEIEVFSRFLLIKTMYFHLEPEVLSTLLFHKDTKKRIRESIKQDTTIVVSEASFNNILSTLRKKKFITGNKIVHNPILTKEGNIQITFNLITSNDATK